MERRCGNCRYADIENNTLPCSDCPGPSDLLLCSLWRRDIKDVDDFRELLCAIFETQMYTLREIERVRNELEKKMGRGKR